MARRLTRADLRNPAVPIVCVDLNGVLDEYTGWKTPGHFDPPRAGAADFLEALARLGFDVVVFTTRHPAGVRAWLRRHGLMRHVGAITNRKPPAHVFVDDRAVCFRGDFARTLRSVAAFRAHWEEADQRASRARSRSRKNAARRSKRRASDAPRSD
jgi:hypothetical protein